MGDCVHPGAYTVSTSSIVLATDVLVLLMPTWILHDLKMPFGRKIMVTAFLSFGVAVTIVGAVRTSVLIKAFVLGEVVRDPTYGTNYTLSNIESGLAIIGTCGPTIKYLLGFCIPALKTPDESSNRGYTYPPPGDSQGVSRYRRTNETLKGNDGYPNKGQETSEQHRPDDDLELSNVSYGRQSDEPRTNSDEHLVITKTVAWRVDASQPDSDSTHEQKTNTPHTVL